MLKDIDKHFDDYLAHFNFKDYDYILVPHENDNHIEHKYIGNVLLKKMLLTQGYKDDLKILRYELWSPISKPNYYEDITDYVDKKTLILNSPRSIRCANEKYFIK